MKGLLLKELYLLRKQGIWYALAIAIFPVLSLLGDDSVFNVIYPGILAALIPLVLLQNDEQSRWSRYCGTLPYSKAQLVSAKYLVSLSAQILALLLSGVAQAFVETQKYSVRWDTYLLQMAIAFAVSFSLSAVSLPLVFRFGAERGSVTCAVILGALCAFLVSMLTLLPSLMAQELPSAATLSVLCLIAAAVYALSWRLSIALYSRI